MDCVEHTFCGALSAANAVVLVNNRSPALKTARSLLLYLLLGEHQLGIVESALLGNICLESGSLTGSVIVVFQNKRILVQLDVIVARASDSKA